MDIRCEQTNGQVRINSKFNDGASKIRIGIKNTAHLHSEEALRNKKRTSQLLILEQNNN